MMSATRGYVSPGTVVSLGVQVLLLEDHSGSRTAMAVALEAAGYACTQVVDEEGALLAVARSRPHAVVYDFHPRSGARMGLARRLRDCAASAGIPIALIAISVLDEPPSLRASECVDGYLVKPFAPRDLEIMLATTVALAGG